MAIAANSFTITAGTVGALGTIGAFAFMMSELSSPNAKPSPAKVVGGGIGYVAGIAATSSYVHKVGGHGLAASIAFGTLMGAMLVAPFTAGLGYGIGSVIDASTGPH